MKKRTQTQCAETFTLIASKTVGMYLLIKKVDVRCPDILVNGEVINIVEHFKYLGMIMDSNLKKKTLKISLKVLE